MRIIKIYGEKYIVDSEPADAIDCYFYKGELVDEAPGNAKLLGYVTMEDGSVVECYKPKSKLLAILLILLLIASVGYGVYYYLFLYEPDVAIGGTMLETNVNKDVITFNGIMSKSNDTVNLEFVNGKYPATVEIVGEGVTCEPISLEPNQQLLDIPVFIDTTENVVEVAVKVSSEGDTAEFNAIIEVPENNNSYTTSEGLSGYFEREVIFSESE